VFQLADAGRPHPARVGQAAAADGAIRRPFRDPHRDDAGRERAELGERKPGGHESSAPAPFGRGLGESQPHFGRKRQPVIERYS